MKETRIQMIQNQRRNCKAEDKMLWWLLTSQVSTRNNARDMTPQIQLLQTMKLGHLIRTVVIIEMTNAFWEDNSITLEESKIANVTMEKISKESSSQNLAHVQNKITNVMQAGKWTKTNSALRSSTLILMNRKRETVKSLENGGKVKAIG